MKPAVLAAYVAQNLDLAWVLDDGQQRLLLGLRPDAFDDDRGVWGIVLAQTYALRGDQARPAIYADSARSLMRSSCATRQTRRGHVFLGLALAYMGRKADAVRERQRGLALMPVAKDARVGPYIQHQLARIYILVGEPEKALDQLGPRGEAPGSWSRDLPCDTQLSVEPP
ncbi:MAG: hypothetical protein H0V09_07130 [Gemmatimonadetes bacterium]|nr:hypothetical protein [Gemmatimonadota bacterium]